MSHTFRFLGAIDPKTPGSWIIDAVEYEHIRKVLRLKAGDEVELFNGSGAVCRGKLAAISKDLILASANPDSIKKTPEPASRFALAVGALKPNDIDDVLAELCELGVDEIHVFLQENVQKARLKDNVEARWQRIILAATKQSKRPWLPQIFTHPSLKTAVETLASFQTRLVLDAASSKSLIDFSPTELKASLSVIIGGERGLNDEELEFCKNNGYHLAKLGHYIMRARTAVLAVAAVIATQR